MSKPRTPLSDAMTTVVVIEPQAKRQATRDALDMATLGTLFDLRTTAKPVFAKRVYHALPPETKSQHRPVEVKASLNRLRDRGLAKKALGVWSITFDGVRRVLEDRSA